ncbi:MAG: signal peptidase I [Ktedonobacteraceae bacterium]
MLFWMIITGSLLLLVVISLRLLRLTLMVVTIQGQSMSPTLEHGDRVVVWRFRPTWWLRRGRIVLIQHQGESVGNAPMWIKRITGLPGETVVTPLEKLPEYRCASLQAQVGQTWQVPPGYFFVQGDNREVSVDSLFWGPISSQQVIGIMLRKLAHGDNTSRLELIQVFGRGPRVGQSAPPFTAETVDGAVKTCTSYAGQSVVFLFICPCQLCRGLLAENETIALKAAQSQVQFVLVSGADVAQTRPFIAMLATSLPVLVAPISSNPFLQDYDISCTPYFCLINERGIVQATGFLDPRRGKWKALTEAWSSANEDGENVTALVVGEHATQLIRVPRRNIQID